MTALMPQNCQRLRAVAKAVLNRKLLREWETAWDQDKRGRSLHRTTPKPTKKVLKVHETVPKAISSVIVQMQTEKIGLRLFLYQRKVPSIESGLCNCRRG